MANKKIIACWERVAELCRTDQTNATIVSLIHIFATIRLNKTWYHLSKPSIIAEVNRFFNIPKANIAFYGFCVQELDVNSQPWFSNLIADLILHQKRIDTDSLHTILKNYVQRFRDWLNFEPGINLVREVDIFAALLTKLKNANQSLSENCEYGGHKVLPLTMAVYNSLVEESRYAALCSAVNKPNIQKKRSSIEANCESNSHSVRLE